MAVIINRTFVTLYYNCNCNCLFPLMDYNLYEGKERSALFIVLFQVPHMLSFWELPSKQLLFHCIDLSWIETLCCTYSLSPCLATSLLNVFLTPVPLCMLQMQMHFTLTVLQPSLSTYTLSKGRHLLVMLTILSIQMPSECIAIALAILRKAGAFPLPSVLTLEGCDSASALQSQCPIWNHQRLRGSFLHLS